MLSGQVNITETDPTVALRIRDLAKIETYYGRLCYLAALRNPDNGRYEHYGSERGSAGNAIANRSMKRIHEAIFRDWVGLSLERKKADIELYISGVSRDNGGERHELIETWLRLTPYKNLVPASIQGPERQRHASDFDAILGLLKNVYGVSSLSQSA